MIAPGDHGNNTVTHYNYTTDTVNGPYDFEPVTDASENYGFSILYRATIEGGMYAIFAEMEQVACVYQLYASGGVKSGNPQFALYREEFSPADLYEKAFSWVRFYADEGSSDMYCGFVAFDDEASGGKLYNASYSHRSFDVSSDTGYNLTADGLEYNEEVVSNLWDFGGWSSTIALTGTPSGSYVIDFGPSIYGGGGGLLIPQTDAVDDLASWWQTVSGTYFALAYLAQSGETASDVRFIKMEIAADGDDGYLTITDCTYDYTVWSHVPLVRIADFPFGPEGLTPVTTTFQDDSSCTNANSSVVNNAYLSKGAFLSYNGTPSEDMDIFMLTFDPEGRFLTYSGFVPGLPISEDIAFGMGIKDAGYSE